MRKLEFAGLLVIVILMCFYLFLLYTHPAHGQGTTLSFICDQWGENYESGHVVAWADMQHPYDLTEDGLLVIASVDASDSFWRGYESERPFDIPDDVETEWKFTVETEYGKRYLMVTLSPSEPEMAYVLAFKTMKPNADQNGEHFGVHPCAVFYSDYETWAWLFDEAENPIELIHA